MFRVPYGKATEVFPRRGIIVGSTNRDEFLVDETGNRRFWVIPVKATHKNPIDLDGLMKEVDAIWASAVHAYQNDEPYALTIEEEAQVNDENSKYTTGDPWKGPIETWLSVPQNKLKDVTTEVLLSDAICKPVERQTKHDQMKVASILRDLGYSKISRKSINGRRPWVYKRDSEEDS